MRTVFLLENKNNWARLETNSTFTQVYFVLLFHHLQYSTTVRSARGRLPLPNHARPPPSYIISLQIPHIVKCQFQTLSPLRHSCCVCHHMAPAPRLSNERVGEGKRGFLMLLFSVMALASAAGAMSGLYQTDTALESIEDNTQDLADQLRSVRATLSLLFCLCFVCFACMIRVIESGGAERGAVAAC